MILFPQFDADTVDSNEDYKNLREKRGYKNEDCIEINREKLPNYDEKVKAVKSFCNIYVSMFVLFAVLTFPSKTNISAASIFLCTISFIL